MARDTVHIVWSDTQQEFDAATFNLNGQSASVYIVVYPMSRAHSGLFRVQVRTTQEVLGATLGNSCCCYHTHRWLTDLLFVLHCA